MKKIKILLVLAAILATLFSCEEAENPSLSDSDLIELTLDRIDKNASMSYDLFATMETSIPYDSISKLIEASATKKMFIDKIMRASLEFFPSVVKANKDGLVLDYIPTPFAGDAEITLKAMVSEEPGSPPIADPIDAYRKKILEHLEATTNNKHKEWIIVQSFNDGNHNRPLPAESMSLNYEEIKFMTTLTDIIMDLDLSDEEVIAAIDALLIINQIPPVAVGMLLPAVQQVREAAASAAPDPFEESSLEWLNANAGQAINGGLNRDIIRRIQASIYLAGLHTIVLDEYPGNNQDMASLSILHARYRVALLMASAEMWGK